MQQRRRPSWSGAFLLTAGLLAGTGCGDNEAPTEPQQLRSPSQSKGFGPDLVIRELRGPSSVQLNQPFTTTLRACNEGTETAQSPIGPVQVDVYLSTDDTLSWPDPNLPPPTDQVLLATLPVNELEAGQCETFAFTTSASPPGAFTDGTYYLGAIVDTQQVLTELEEANNTVVTQLGLGDLPDLVITELQGPKHLASYGNITPTIKVCNQGTNVSTNTLVEFFLSTDGTLSQPGTGGPPPSNQVSLGLVPVPELNPGHCAIRQVSLPVIWPSNAPPGQPLYLGAIVDTPQSASELNENNNTFVGELIAVGEGYDLTVTSVQGPTSVRSGDPFEAAVRVCNHGTLPTGPTSAELYLSVDGNVTVPGNGPPPPGQVLVGQTQMPFLNPGDCLTRNIQATATLPAGAPMDGAVFLAAIADSADGVPELREDNNVFVQGLIGVGDGPDLVVTAIRAPPSVSSWPSPTPVSVTVCNEGTVSTSMVAVELYLSMVPTLDVHAMGNPSHGTQAQVGGLNIPNLDAGRCVTREVPIYVNLPQGTPPGLDAFYLGAVADPWSNLNELREENNVFVGGRIGVGERPDLVITSVEGPPNHAPGAFPVTARVCNQGTQRSYSTLIEFYLAAHGYLNAPVPGGAPYYPDPYTAIRVGTHSVPPLQPGECQSLSATVDAWSFPSEYHGRAFNLGAIVDPHAYDEELREDNNTFVGGLIGMGDRPDLSITVTQAPVSVRDGDPFSTTLKVCNLGTAHAQSTVAHVYLAMEPNLVFPNWNAAGSPLPWSQRFAGSVNIPSLNERACVTVQVNGSADIPSGSHEQAFYLGAGVDMDPYVPELRADNNTFVYGRIGVGLRPDLVITALTAPASVTPHGTFNATVTVCNQGTDVASQTDLELYFSTQSTLELPRWYGPGFPFPETQYPLGVISVQSLLQGQCTTQSVQASVNSPHVAAPDQPLYLGAIIDVMDNTQELREDNNTFVSGLMGVGNRPDLVITAIQAPPNVGPHATFNPSVTVCNQGTNASYSTRVEFHVSTEEEIVMPRWNGPGHPLPSTQQPIGELNIPPLNAGRCFTGGAVVTMALPPAAMPDQPLYLGATVDEEQSEQELREDNNIFMSGRIGVGTAPDLLITSVTGPSSVEPHNAFTTTVTVCNQGTMEASPARVEVHLSTEPALVIPPWYSPGPPSDTQVFAGDLELPLLEVDDCVTLSIPSWAGIPSAAQMGQPLYLGAIVDPSSPTGELREDNNTFIGGLLGVGYGPDLVITALQAPASVAPQDTFTTTVTVCNQGTQTSSNTQVNLYFSTQAQVVLPQWNGPGAPYPSTQETIGTWSVQSLNPGQCITEPVPAWVSLPQAALPEQPLYLGAAVDTDRMQTELREDNNTFVSGLMGVGSRPDLVITSISAPNSVRAGYTFTASVRVCNQGTTSTYGSTVVELYLSSNGVFEFPYQGGPGGPSENQSLAGTVSVPNLDAGQCVLRSTQMYASTPPDSDPIGFFYLGAIADPWLGLEELREDNNILADRFIMVTP